MHKEFDKVLRCAKKKHQQANKYICSILLSAWSDNSDMCHYMPNVQIKGMISDFREIQLLSCQELDDKNDINIMSDQ